jgi:uncharacterized membrane protein
MENPATSVSATRQSASGASGEAAEEINLAPAERQVSMIGGGLLALYGLSRLSFKGLAMAAAGGTLFYRGLTGHCPAYSALGIDTAHPEEVLITEAVTIGRSQEELYSFWRDLENLPQFMHHLESVHNLDGSRSHWSARVPGGLGNINWDAEVTETRAFERISWRSLPGAPISNAGTVLFREAPGGRGTEVQVTIAYSPPAGTIGAAAARMLNPALSRMIREDVRRFKSLMEAGEVPTVTGQPSGQLH